MKRWRVTAYLINDALGRPVDPRAEGASAVVGEYRTRWGARRVARRHSRFAARHRSPINEVTAALGLAPMRHRYAVEPLPRAGLPDIGTIAGAL